MPPSLNDLLKCVREKFDSYLTMNGRFNCGKSRAHYVLVSLSSEAHLEHYKKIVQGANVSCLEFVVENGHKEEHLQMVDGTGVSERWVGYVVEVMDNLGEDTPT